MYDALEGSGITEIEHGFADREPADFFTFSIEVGEYSRVIGNDRGEFYRANMRYAALWATDLDLGVVLDAVPSQGGFKTAG